MVVLEVDLLVVLMRRDVMSDRSSRVSSQKRVTQRECAAATVARRGGRGLQLMLGTTGTLRVVGGGVVVASCWYVVVVVAW